MKNLIKYIIVLLIILSLTEQFSVSNEKLSFDELVSSNIESARVRENPPAIKITDEQIKAADPNKILEDLLSYEKDQDSRVRSRTHRFIVRVANLHPDNVIVRQEVTKRLVMAEFDMSDRGAYRMMNLTAKDFNNQSKTLIRQALINANLGKTGGDPSVWLCGIANIQEELPQLKEFLIDEEDYDKNSKYMKKWYYTTAWTARLARARMGVKEDIEKCISLLESEIKKNPYEIHSMLNYLEYIRQPESIKCLESYLNSDLRLPRTNPDEPGELISNYIIEILIDNLENFPIKKNVLRAYSPEQIDIARKWMSEQKEWQIIR